MQDREHLKILKAIGRLEEPSQSDVAEEIGESRQNFSKTTLPKLQENGWVEIDDTGWQKIVRLTEQGKEKVLKNNGGTTSPSEVDKIVDENPRFIHRFEVGFEIQNAEELPDSWKERVLEEADEEYNYVDEFERYSLQVDKWRFRISGNFIYVKLKDEIRGENYREVKDRAIEQAKKGAEYFQNLDSMPIVLSDAPCNWRIAEQHIGSSGDNLVHAFVKHIDEKTEQNVSNFRVYGDEGEDDRELLIWADKSSGELHEESGNGGNPSGSRERAEDVQAFTEEITEAMVSRPDQTREIFYNGAERINKVENHVQQVQKVAGTMQESVEEVKQVQEEISGMKEVIQDNKRTREALHEQVRAINELAQRNQELIEGRVVQEEESQSEEDLVEETIRDILSDDSFSRPGLQYGHLMAWKDGKCVKLLDKSVVENSSSEFVELVDQWKP
jgi:DNA-binding MarR family transcriptional regulator